MKMMQSIRDLLNQCESDTTSSRPPATFTAPLSFMQSSTPTYTPPPKLPESRAPAEKPKRGGGGPRGGGGGGGGRKKVEKVKPVSSNVHSAAPRSTITTSSVSNAASSIMSDFPLLSSIMNGSMQEDEEP